VIVRCPTSLMDRKHTSFLDPRQHAAGRWCTELIEGEGIVAKSGFEMGRAVWEAVVTEACQDLSLDGAPAYASSSNPMMEGPGADFGEKHEPASDIDTAVGESLKALDLKRSIREADIGPDDEVRKVPQKATQYEFSGVRTIYGAHARNFAMSCAT
jgi:hypothetical protein